MEESKEGSKDLFKLDYVTHNKEVGHIKAESELRFMLLRHWTLFESINNSTYMMAKLNLWKEPGQKSLRDFLLQIGIPLDQAKQKFSFMDPELKSELTDRIRRKAETFGLGEILQHSFVRQYDSKTQFSSQDMAYAITSLLEHPNVSGESGH